MTISKSDLEILRVQYLAFITKLIQLTKLRAGMPFPQWFEELCDRPFVFPYEFEDDQRFMELQEQLLRLSEHAEGSRIFTDDASEIVCEIRNNLTITQTNISTPHSPNVPRSSNGRGFSQSSSRIPNASRSRKGRSSFKRSMRKLSTGSRGAIPMPRHETSRSPEATESEDIGLLGPSDKPSVPSAPVLPPTTAAETPALSEKRYLNAGIKDREAGESLVVDETYLLEFAVDLEKKGNLFSRAYTR